MATGTAAAVMLAVALAGDPGGAAPAPGGVERRREEIAHELVRVGAELRRAILAGDAAALAARVPADGLRCAGEVVPRERVLRDLGTPGAWLHGRFFGERAAPAHAGPPRSVAELLRTAADVAMAVSFVADRRAGEVGRPCLEFRARDVPAPEAPLCFELRDGRWWLTESLYPCG